MKTGGCVRLFSFADKCIAGIGTAVSEPYHRYSADKPAFYRHFPAGSLIWYKIPLKIAILMFFNQKTAFLQFYGNRFFFRHTFRYIIFDICEMIIRIIPPERHR